MASHRIGQFAIRIDARTLLHNLYQRLLPQAINLRKQAESAPNIPHAHSSAQQDRGQRRTSRITPTAFLIKAPGTVQVEGCCRTPRALRDARTSLAIAGVARGTGTFSIVTSPPIVRLPLLAPRARSERDASPARESAVCACPSGADCV